MKPAAELRITSQFYILQVVFLASLLAGCGPSLFPSYVYTSKISIDDRHALLPALRTSIDIGRGEEAASHPHTGHAVEFGMARVSGSGSQFLSNGQSPVILSGTTLNGPQQLNSTFDLNLVDFSYRWRKFPWETPLGFELSGGFGFPSLNITVSSPTQSASGSYGDAMLQFNPGLIYRLNPSSSVHVRIGAYSGGSSNSNAVGLNSISHAEISFAYAFNENLSLRAGYASWTIRGDDKSGQSGFDLHATGPTLLFSMDFNARSAGDPEQSAQDQPIQDQTYY